MVCNCGWQYSCMHVTVTCVNMHCYIVFHYKYTITRIELLESNYTVIPLGFSLSCSLTLVSSKMASCRKVVIAQHTKLGKWRLVSSRSGGGARKTMFYLN